MADPQEQPQSESLAGWMRRWLRLPTVGLPEAKALLAAEEERRRALRQQLSDAIPERLKSLAGMATDYLGQQFTPSPEMTEVGTRLKAMTNGGPVYGPMARFGVDQFVDSTTPGGAMTNIDLPVAELAKFGGVAGLALMRGGLKVVEDVPRGLYSRVDEALKLIPTKGAHPNKVASLLKSNASAEELAFRKVPEFLAAKGNATVTPAELAAHLAAHPAPMPVVKTLGGTTAWSPELERAWNNREFGTLGTRPSTPQDWMDASGRLERIAQQWQRNGDKAKADKYFRLSEEATTHAEYLDLGRGGPAGQPKYASYQVPGGENYRETLSTLPQQPNNPYEAFIAKMDQKYGEGYDTDVLTPDERTMQSMLWERSQRGPGAITEGQFRSGHFDEPNILVHTRSNERTLPTGEPGRFVEEVQSDWHQQGARSGYQQPIPATSNLTWNEYARANGIDPAEASQVFGDVTDQRFNEWFNSHQEAVDIANRNVKAVPDAPFKESWPDLGLKQQVLEAANDPNAQWIGHTSGQTQAARYDLSKQISRVEYSPKSGPRLGSVRAYDHDGNRVLEKFAEPGELPDIIGKEATEKLLATAPREGGSGRGVHMLEGMDLQVGGEGMRHFYDNLLPKRLEKILKPFGGRVERGAVPAPSDRTKHFRVLSPEESVSRRWVVGSRLPDGTNQYFDTESEARAAYAALVAQHTQQEPAWIARLTPEMKARIRREGLPLLSLLGMGALWQAPNERPENRQ